MMEITISTLAPGSHHLRTVIELGDVNSAKLGFFPEAAFYQAAMQGHILVALTPEDKCVGYLLFRIVKTKQTVSITHLCVENSFRGQGIARRLVEALIENTKNWRGISLFSRRDYASTSLWEHLGFVYSGEKQGRGKDKMALSRYWFDHQHPSLLNWAHRQLIEGKTTQAVIDANVVYNLKDNPHHPLLADWLSDDVALLVTPELANEINRNESIAVRKFTLDYVRNTYPTIEYDQKKYTYTYNLLKQIYPSNISRTQHESDLKQVSYAITGDADFFLTEDDQLISRLGSEVYAQFGLKVVRPVDLIVHLDELMNSAKYQPNRLAGSSLSVNRVPAGQSDLLAQTFQFHKDEKKSHLAGKLRTFLANPKSYEVQVVSTPFDELLAIIVYSKGNPSFMEVPVIRLAPQLKIPALASYVIFRAVRFAVENGWQLVKVVEEYLSEDVIEALRINSFTQQDAEWVKFNLDGQAKIVDLQTRLTTLRSLFTENESLLIKLMEMLEESSEKGSSSSWTEIERLIWPGKIIDAVIPCYIVPIQAEWAKDLFDSFLGRQTLFGAVPELALNMDNVYYRAARPSYPTAPSRILWYVSRGTRNYQGVMSIRACSYVDEVVVGTPKDLYKQFAKLGTYSWSNVYETAKDDINRKILAFRFSRTELFPNPISLQQLMVLLGRRSAPMTVMKIPVDIFSEIYKIGTIGGKL